MPFFNHYCKAFWQISVELAPWLLLGVIIAGVLHVFLPTDFVRRHLGSNGFRGVLKATLLGVPMPLCSCGVIPAAIGLKKDGASDGAATGFLISTPQTGIDSIAVSAAFLGFPFALFKVVSAFITGLLGGVLVNVTEAAQAPVHETAGPHSCRHQSAPAASLPKRFHELLAFSFSDLLRGIWKWIMIGILVSAAISTAVPENTLAGQPWATGLSGMLVMLLIAMPLYVCATGSVPIAASLVAAGMPTGAALVFLMAGPATNLATLGAVYHEFGRRVTIIYIAVIAVSSILLGWLFEVAVGNLSIPATTTGHHHHAPLAIILTIGMFAIFAYYAISAVRQWQQARRRVPAHGEETVVMQVIGMSCAGCVRNIQAALSTQHGVHSSNVDLKSGLVTISGRGCRLSELQEAVREAGYQMAENDTDLAGNSR